MLMSKMMKKNRMTRERADEIIEKSKSEPPLELEKGDLPAILLAAFITFTPFILVLGGAMWFVYWFIFNVWAR